MIDYIIDLFKLRRKPSELSSNIEKVKFEIEHMKEGGGSYLTEPFIYYSDEMKVELKEYFSSQGFTFEYPVHPEFTTIFGGDGSFTHTKSYNPQERLVW